MDKKYILVVDDDPDLVETVAMMLESKGCEVGRAYDGIEGEESIKERRPDLVILDIMMPRKDGYVLCAELKADEKTRDIPVVLLTAVGEAVPTTSYTHADGMATEADDYIAKPIESLVSQVRNCQLGRQFFQDLTNTVELLQPIDRCINHKYTPSRVDSYKAFSFKQSQRFADRNKTDPKLGCNGFLVKAGTQGIPTG